MTLVYLSIVNLLVILVIPAAIKQSIIVSVLIAFTINSICWILTLSPSGNFPLQFFDWITPLFAFHYFYFHFLNMIKTSRRLKILFEIFQTERVTDETFQGFSTRLSKMKEHGVLTSSNPMLTNLLTTIAFVYVIFKKLYGIR